MFSSTIRCRKLCFSAFRSSASFSSSAARAASQNGKSRDKYNYNPDVFSSEHAHANYKRVTANDLESYKTPPREVRMLVRDFIEDSLYNPNYGYFSKRASILASPPTGFDFNAFHDSAEFQEEVAKRYDAYGNDELGGPGKQLWHTPTELFKPWYGESIARCLVSEYLLKYFPYEDFKIYEIGAGNGTLALNILDFLAAEYPEVYDRTQYTIVEISANLAQLQRQKLSKAHPCVKVVNKSVFHWNTKEPAPCFFLAMEVVDNFAHDVLRYDMRTLEPYQGIITVDENGDFGTYYTRVTDPLISTFLSLRRELLHPPPLPRLLKASNALRKVYTSLPFAPNLSVPEYIPTRLMSLVRTLRQHFPRHRLLLSDFASLPDTIEGINAPVVQTRYQSTTVPCTTLLVKQGYFDIFFPTDFERLRDMYEHALSQPDDDEDDGDGLGNDFSRSSPMATSSSSLTLGSDFFSSHHPRNRRRPLDGIASASGLPVGERKSSVFTHAQFLETYADLSKTRLRNGENPMVDYYRNVKFLF